MLMEHPRFNECIFAEDLEGHPEVGSSAYMVPEDLHEEIFGEESTYNLFEGYLRMDKHDSQLMARAEKAARKAIENVLPEDIEKTNQTI